MFPRSLILGASTCALLAAHAAAQTHKSPRPVPLQADVKTPPPALVAKDSAAVATPVTPKAAPVRKPAQSQAPVVDVFAEGALFDETASGLWASHAGWKACFAGATTTFVPHFGAQAPRNVPVAFSVASITVDGQEIASAAQGVARDGQRVTIERGAIDEAYELSAQGIEQMFTIETPVAGEIRVRIAVEGDYVIEPTDDGLAFSNELGRVRYGRAFLVDANGRKTAIETEFDGQAIELVAPRDLVVASTFPIVIDPLISNFAVNDTIEHTVHPDVAYEDVSGKWLYVYERVFSAIDSDVFAYAMNDTGLLPSSFRTIDVSSTSWARPSVASSRLGANFLVAAQVGAEGARQISARTVSAGSLTVGAIETVSGPEAGDKINPSVGGDPNPLAPTYYFVVWERVLSASDHDIHGRLLNHDATANGGVRHVDNSGNTIDTLPAISKCSGVREFASQEWNIVWQREFLPTDRDVYGAQVHWDGFVTHATFPIMTSALDETNPKVSSLVDGDASPRHYLVVMERGQNGGDANVYGTLCLGNSTVTNLDISAAIGTAAADQRSPVIETDGSQFLVAWTEQFSGPDYDVYAVALWLSSGVIGIHESVIVPVDTSTSAEGNLAIASKHTGGEDSVVFGIAHQSNDLGGSDDDVWFAAFAGPAGGPIDALCFGTNALCPCGNAGLAGHGCANSVNPAGALLVGTGVASVGDDTLVLTTTGMPATATGLYFQGSNALNGGNGTTFGDGLRCAGGLVTRLGTKTSVGGASSYPEVGDLPISERGNLPAAGAVRYYQTWYRNAAAYCTASTFNLSNALEVTWVL